MATDKEGMMDMERERDMLMARSRKAAHDGHVYWAWEWFHKASAYGLVTDRQARYIQELLNKAVKEG